MPNKRKERSRSHHRRPRFTEASSSSTHNKPVLPGFYFDPDKNRYFKIEDKPKTTHIEPNVNLKTESEKQKITSPGSFSQLLYKRSRDQIRPHVFERRVYQVSACASKKQVVTAPCHRGTITHLQNNETQDVLLASAKFGHGAALWRYNITKCNKFYVHINRDENFIFSPASEITDVTFLPPNIRPGSVALISLLGGAAQHGRVSLLDLSQGTFLSTYYAPQANVWSCCWSRQAHHSLCIGASKEGYVQDIVSNTRQLLYTHKSDVLCIRSAERSPVVYTGSRNSLLICHDLRTRESPFKIEHQSSVGDIHLMRDEQRLISCAFNGQVVQWDTRIQKHVVAYEGHSNDYARVKVKVDESESLLLIPGKDLQTRIWGVDTGHLINSLHPPAVDSIISNQNIPAVEVGLAWAGLYPGFIVAATGLLHWYSL